MLNKTRLLKIFFRIRWNVESFDDMKEKLFSMPRVWRGVWWQKYLLFVLASRISEIINFLWNVPREIEARDILNRTLFVNKIVWRVKNLSKERCWLSCKFSFNYFQQFSVPPSTSALNAFKAFFPVCIYHSNATAKLNS